MKKRFLLQNLISFLMPAVVPLVIFSLVVSAIAFRYTSQEVDRSNQVSLQQSQLSLERMFNTAGRIGADITSGSSLPIIMKNLLQNKTVAYENYNNYKLIQSYLQMQISSEPTVASIYVYVNNPHKQFFVSNGSLYALSTFYDTAWFDTYLANQSRVDGYYERRIAPSGFAPGSQSEYLTLYCNMYYPGGNTSEGVIVVNLRQDMVRKNLDSFSGHASSAFLITDSDGAIVCSDSNAAKAMHMDQLPEVNDLEELSGSNMLSCAFSSVFPWRYCLITPYAYAYRMPLMVVQIMLAFLAGSLLLAFALAYVSSRHLSRSISRIMEILDQAKSDPADPVPPSAPRNSYEYIIQNLLEMFVKQNYLKVQLSEKHYRLQVMELLALQSQINPHFLYNTLQTIYLKALSFTGKPNQVNDMLEHLMIILRYSLSSPTNMAALTEDLRCTRSYVYLERQQYGQQLVVRWHTDNVSQDAQVPKLLIQPLVENCVRHGMRGDGSVLEIDIMVKEIEGDLLIQITDNGRGLPQKDSEQVCRNLHMALSGQTQDVDTQHIGLLNTAKRLYLNYQGSCEMRFSSVEAKGTCVTIRIPSQTRDAA